MKRASALVLLALAAPLAAYAQSSSKAVVNVSAVGPATPVKPGQAFDVPITLTIRSGYHINAQKPSEDYLIGTSLTIQPPSGFTVVKTAYPAARYARFSFSETPLAVYEGSARITVTLKAASSVQPGAVTIPGKLTFQACNDQQCLPPSTVDVSGTVEVAASDEAAGLSPQTVTITGASTGAKVSLDGRPAGQTNTDGRLLIRYVTPGRHRIRVELDGTVAMDKTVDVTTEPVTIAVPPAQGESPPAQPQTDPQPAVAAESVSTPAPNSVEPAVESESSTPLYIGGGVVVGVLAALGIYAATRRR